MLNSHKNFRLCILLVSLILFNPYIWSQNLSIEEFISVPFDLSSRTSSVSDNNGVPCALVKIICNDEVTGVQGNVIKSENHSNEYWVYLTAGTKRFKILTLHHVPLEIHVNKDFPDGLTSHSTYQLNLKSDLPPDILYGASDQLKPIAICKDGEPLLPKWWNIHEEGMYVGVSPASSFDGDVAKLTAINNAIYSFVHSKGCYVEYNAEVEQDDETEKYAVIYKAIKEGFSIKISQEYYNSDGQYFVLCSIDNDSNSSNSMMINWKFEDENLNGSLAVETIVQAKINRSPFESQMTYKLSWSPDTNNVQWVSNGKKLVDINHPKKVDDIGNFILGGDLGVSQLRLLTAIPLLSDSIRYSTVFETTENEDQWSRKMMIFSYGRSICRDIKLYDYSNGSLKFGVSEYFPEIPWKNDIGSERISQETGLSNKYYRFYTDDNGHDTAIESLGYSQGDLLETMKNISLLQGIDLGLEKLTGYIRGIRWSEDQNIDVSEKFYSKAKIYPFFYLDPDERESCLDKKYRKSWTDNRDKLKNLTHVILAIDPAIYE